MELISYKTLQICIIIEFFKFFVKFCTGLAYISLKRIRPEILSFFKSILIKSGYFTKNHNLTI